MATVANLSPGDLGVRQQERRLFQSLRVSSSPFIPCVHTCSNNSTVYLEGKAGGGGGLARPLSWQAGGILFTERPVL